MKNLSVSKLQAISRPALACIWLLMSVAAAGSPPGSQTPVANAGPDQTVVLGATVTLNGSGSSDADGDALIFKWVFAQLPPGSRATLDNRTSVMPQFIADLPGQYVLDLYVSDGRHFSLPDSVEVTTDGSNTPPVANAGLDRNATVGETVTLDGSGSTDVDGDPLQFNWSFDLLPAGSQAQLLSSDSVRATFVPDLAGAYIVRLAVDDGRGGTASDLVVISTADLNQPPLADAGPDQAVAAGSPVTLDGSNSSDPEGSVLSFSWSFVSRPAGSQAALTDASSMAPAFVADTAGDYVLQLIVNDGLADSAADTVLVTSNNTPPVADAGLDQLATTGGRVFLNGSNSSDANGDALAYSWSFLTRPGSSAAVLYDAQVPITHFIADVAGLYVLQLIVNDGVVDSVPDTLTVTVDPPPNSDPVASRDEVIVEFGNSVVIDVLANDHDDDGDTLTIASVTDPVNGTAVIEAGGVRYVSDTGFSGFDFFSYTVSDGRGGMDSAGIDVRVGPEPGTVTVVATDDRAGELGPDEGTFLVSRVGPTADPVTINFALLGSATNGVDFQTLPGSVTIPAGAASAPIQVIPIPDGIAEGAEGVLLVLSPGPGYVIGTPGIAAISIADSIAVSVAAIDDSASEAILDPAAFVITRTGDLTSRLLVNVAVSGTANRNLDVALTNIIAGSLVDIPAGAASITIDVTPLRDNRVEGIEDLVLTINPGGNYSIGSPANATITIADDPAIVTLQASDASASETGPDPGTFVFTRTGGDISASLSIRCAFAGGTATSGQDFTPNGCGLTLPANVSQVALDIVPIVDTRVEGVETVIAEIRESLNGSYLIGTPSVASVTIAD